MKRTFSVTREDRRGAVAAMTINAHTFVIHADPIETSMGFPVLVVTGWVGDAEDFAERVAALLQGAQL